MDTEPSHKRHQELEKGKCAGDPDHFPALHGCVLDAVRNGNGKGVHGKAEAQQYAVENKDKCALHNVSFRVLSDHKTGQTG